MNIDAEPAMIENAETLQDQTVALRPMPKSIWMHGLTIIIVLALSNLAMTLTFASGVVQFFWMLITKERNAQIERFGEGLSDWLGKAVGFVTGKSDVKPFPWSDWKA